MNYHSVCLHVISDSIRRCDILFGFLNLKQSRRQLDRKMFLFASHLTHSLLLSFQCRSDTGILAPLSRVMLTSFERNKMNKKCPLTFSIFLLRSSIFQGWKCRGPMFGIGIYYSLYACYATLQSHWWCLASDGTSKHSFFCIKQMLETGSLFSIKCFLNVYVFFPYIERSINLSFSSTLFLYRLLLEKMSWRYYRHVSGRLYPVTLLAHSESRY